MKAVIYKDIGDIRIEDIDEPSIEQASDAIIRIISSSICGTDLHMVRGTMAGMKSGTVLGHEAVGIVEAVGPAVKTIESGDRVVVCSTIACGECIYCKAEEYASCDIANPKGAEAGTAFFGGPEAAGSFNGLQAERARIPFADVVLVKVPAAVSNEDALLCSDILPTGYMGAEIADVQPGDFIAVFGCGPVGQMAIASAMMMGAKTVFGIDVLPDRLEAAARQGAIPINYESEDPVEALKQMTNGFGPDGCIDAVGVDAQAPHEGPAQKRSIFESVNKAVQQKTVAPRSVVFGDQWKQGDSPFQALQCCIEAVRKSGVVAIIGVYPQTANTFPIGLAMQKSLTIRAANCSHRKYVPKLLNMIESSSFRPSQILKEAHTLDEAIDCYKSFDKREPGWLKVELLP